MPMNNSGTTIVQSDTDVIGATTTISNIPMEVGLGFTTDELFTAAPAMKILAEDGALLGANLLTTLTDTAPSQPMTNTNGTTTTKKDDDDDNDNDEPPQTALAPEAVEQTIPEISPTAATPSNLPMRKRKQSNGTEDTTDDTSIRSSPTASDHKKIKTEESPPTEVTDLEATELADALLLSGITKSKLTSSESDEDPPTSPAPFPPTGTNGTMQRMPMSKAREIRLEQNRKAARESRRRKKIMIEELQRSVIFFSRANGTLKQRNDDLERLLLQAKAQVQAFESGKHEAAVAAAAVKVDCTEEVGAEDVVVGEEEQVVASEGNEDSMVEQLDDSLVSAVAAPASIQPTAQDQQQMPQLQQQPQMQQQLQLQTQNKPLPPMQQQLQQIQCQTALQTQDESQQAQAQQAVACAQAQQQAQAHAARAAVTQAMFESQGFPPAAARAAAQTFGVGSPPPIVNQMAQQQPPTQQVQGQIPQQQVPTVDNGGGNGVGVGGANVAQIPQIQPIAQQVPMQPQNGGNNPWPSFMMAMQQAPTLPGTAPAMTTQMNGMGQQVQAQAQAGGNPLNDAFMAMQQQYNAAACNPLMIQPVPVPNPAQNGMFVGQPQGMIMPPLQQQQQNMVAPPQQQQQQVQNMVAPPPQQQPEQQQQLVPTILCENPNQGNVGEVTNTPIVEVGLAGTIAPVATGNV